MDDDAWEDADLLRAHAAGDPHAFARLYDRYDRASFVFIRRLLGAAHIDAAEDLHQESWVAVARNAGGFDPAKARFPAWLFTIARRKVLDHFRRRKIAVLAWRAEDDDDDAVGLVADPGLTPLEQMQSRERAEEIAAAGEALPLEQRGVLIMFIEGDLSLAEIADITGVATETVKSRLRYARAKLRRSLGFWGPAHV